MAQDRGFMIATVVKNAAFEIHLRKLAEQRERRAASRAAREKREACTAATVQASNELLNEIIYNDNTKGAKCQV